MTLADRLAEGGEGVREPTSTGDAIPPDLSPASIEAVVQPWPAAAPRAGALAPIRFADDLPARLGEPEREQLLARLGACGPWRQGPFVIAGDLCVGDRGQDHLRWAELAPEIAEDVPGRRVLDVGSDAGYDAFMFARLGAASVVGVDSGPGHQQAALLETIYRTGARFCRLDWRDLDPANLGQFDIVHCHALLGRAMHPMALLEVMRPLLRAGGTLLLGTLVLSRPEQSECIHVVPSGFAGDPTVRLVPGRLALRWMLHAAGFAVRDELAMRPVPDGQLRVDDGYVRCIAADTASTAGDARQS